MSLVLTKCDLISDTIRSSLIDKFEKWGYQAITLDLEKSDCFKNLLAELKQKECSIFMGPIWSWQNYFAKYDYSRSSK